MTDIAGTADRHRPIRLDDTADIAGAVFSDTV